MAWNQNKWKTIIMPGIVLILIIVIIVVMVSVLVGKSAKPLTGNADNTDKSWLEMRLKRNIIPENYTIFLDVSISDFTYKGNVSIFVNVIKETNVILLHKVGLNISSTQVRKNDNGNLIEVSNQFSYAPNEFWVIETKETLKKSSYVINIEFHAMITTDLSGFYRNVYKDNGKPKRLASTFFSPISARKAFPCFDEPSFKALFSLTLKYDKEYTALANMPAINTSREDGKKVTSFQTTLRMSTYIVCWAISTYKHKALNTSEGLVIKAWGKDEELHKVHYILEAHKTVLKKLEVYFNISFPLKKLDIFAVPSFGPSAMENWGLITYRESRIYIDNTTTQKSKRDAFMTTAHELVHQWFGNLATMDFWTEAWLKEGFATYIGILVGDRVEPSFHLLETMLPDLMIPALDIDSFATSNPISTQAKTPDEIREVFGIITYKKGCSIVQMLQHYMGKDAFRKGLQRYLTTYAYKNANQDGLWQQLSKEANGKDIKAVMDTWTLQMGYPLITVTQLNDTHARVHQTKFSLDPPETRLPTSPFGYRWKVPLIFQHWNNGSAYEHLLDKETAIFRVSRYSILNPRHNLYYRVKYGDQMIKHLTKELKYNHTIIHLLDRTGLISDQFNIFKANLTTLTNVFNLLSYARNETEPTPWKSAVDQILIIRALLDDDLIKKKKLDSFVIDLIQNHVEKIQWTNHSAPNVHEFELTLLSLACKLNVTNVVENIVNLYRLWMKEKNLSIKPDLLQKTIECAILHNSDHQTDIWEYAYRKYLEAKSVAILDTLAVTENQELIDRLLQESLNDTIINKNYTPYFVGNIARSSQTGRERAWKFIQVNWIELMKRYGNNIFLLSRMLSGVLYKFSTQEKLEDIGNFFKNKTELGSGKQAIKQSTHEIRFNIVYKRIIKNSEWFSKYG